MNNIKKLMVAPIRTETETRKLKRKKIVDKYFKKEKKK